MTNFQRQQRHALLKQLSRSLDKLRGMRLEADEVKYIDDMLHVLMPLKLGAKKPETGESST